MPMPFSSAGQALGLAGMIPGMGGSGDQLESEEERRKRLGMVAQQRSLLTQNSSPAAASLFGSAFGSGLGGF